MYSMVMNFRAFRFTEVVNPDHIAMRHLGREQKLLLETGQDFRIRGHLGTDDFQGNDSIHLAIGGLVDRPHAALAEEFENLVAVAKKSPNLQQDRACAGGVRYCRRWDSRRAEGPETMVASPDAIVAAPLSMGGGTLRVSSASGFYCRRFRSSV